MRCAEEFSEARPGCEDDDNVIVDNSSLTGADVADTDDVREMPLRLVKPGMIIMQDLRSQSGALLVTRGFEVSESFLQRLHNSGASVLAELVKVKVIMAAPDATAVAVIA